MSSVPPDLKDAESAEFSLDTFVRWFGPESGQKRFTAARDALDRAAVGEAKAFENPIAFRGICRGSVPVVGVSANIGGDEYDWAEVV